MNDRVQRTARLFRLREQQHAQAELHLRVAQIELDRHDRALVEARIHIDAILHDGEHALQAGAADEWMLACAEVGIARQCATRSALRRGTAAKNVQEASDFEQAARMCSKQMGSLFEAQRTIAKEAAVRNEQLQLDEMSRNLRFFSNEPRCSTSML